MRNIFWEPRYELPILPERPEDKCRRQRDIMYMKQNEMNEYQ